MKNINEIRTIIENTKTRSAWNTGVKAYALELVDGLEYTLSYNEDALCNERMLHKALLDGASSWNEYSYGGCSLIYDREIAERLCNATELKRTRNGERKPNSREEWLDTQARALYQAERMIIKAAQ